MTGNSAPPQQANDAEKRRDYLDVSYSKQRKPQTPYPVHLCNMIADRYFQCRKGSLLDVGCGRGDQIKAMAQIGFSVTGCDLSPRAKEYAEGAYPVEVLNFETDPFPWPDNHFDFILCKSIIEHMWEPDKLVSKCLRVLKPGGKAIFITPNWDKMFRVFYTEYTHRTPFTQKSLMDCMLINGFNQVQVHNLIQLPWVWKWPKLKFLSSLLARLPESFKRYKSVRFSKEIMLLGVGTK